MDRHRITLACLFLISVVFLLPVGAIANTLQVGPGKPFATPCAAIAVAAAGDTIQIDTSGNYAGDVCAWTTNNLHLVGVGSGRAVIDANGRNAQGKGIWVINNADGTIIENIEFMNATVPDANGAGIRIDGGSLTVRNCYFHDNQNGILAGDSPGTMLVEFSEFNHNGSGDGFTHNIYVTHYVKFIFRYNYSHDSVVGHLVKSRAAENHILYNRLSDENGTGSYELDLPNGGKSYVIGNLIEQGPKTENSTVLSYQEEGPVSSNPDHQLFVVDNTFVNNHTGGTFVFVDGSVTVPAVIKNNIFQGPGRLSNQGIAVLATNFTGNALLVAPASFDYHLQAGSPAVDAGSDPGSGAGMPLTPAFQYVHPACAEGRVIVGPAMDIGAYEFGGGTGVAPPSAPTACGAGPPPPAPVASLSPSSVSFANQAVNTTSGPQKVTLTNSGSATLNITGITFTGTNSADFAETNTCGTSLAAGASCTIDVVFKPTATGTRTATLSVADNASGSPQTVSLTGSGTATSAPGATMSPTNLTFANQIVGTTSAAQTAKLTNSGSSVLTINGITITGANPTDFTQTNTCGTSLAAGANCSASITFRPLSGGSRNATLSVVDNAPGSPQTAALSGTGMDFSLSTSSGSAAINAGQSVNFTAVVSPDGGFNQVVSLSCSGAPKAATCTVSPTSLALNGSGASSATVSIATAARSLTLPGPRVISPYVGLRIVVLLASATLIFFAVARRRCVRLEFAAALLLFLAIGGCSGTVSRNGDTGTPAGTYTLTVTAASTGVTHTASFSLAVN